MSQAIQTKYLPATNRRGSRIKAWCDRGSIVVPYRHGDRDAHRYTMEQLIQQFLAEDAKRYGSGKNPWSGPWVEGGLPNNGGFVFVSAFSDEAFTVTQEAE